eukprot:CAMPEP_0181483650 /NCGR_PEP_ID=MMETSP1110-20121109/45539_1 /TAXON_ID=174948 /ORGANISM="Symbiodinium sp., Strain CCMP421" /LENGTH=37 /DNA_ID= /DNA_START= /DNA_END= /DNA_ORIENTATION=
MHSSFALSDKARPHLINFITIAKMVTEIMRAPTMHTM